MNYPVLLTVSLCTAVSASIPVYAQKDESPSAWNRVWKALPTAPVPEPVPAVATQEGAPLREAKRVLFRFRAPAGVTKVYLAGSFNGWASNNGGRVTDSRFEMTPTPTGIWYKWVALSPQAYQYKYVVVDKNGMFQWQSDPAVAATDTDGNTTLDFATIDAVPDSSKQTTVVPKPRRALKPFVPRIVAATNPLDVRLEKVWVRPDQANVLTVKVGTAAPHSYLVLQVETPFGVRVFAKMQPCRTGINQLTVPALKQEGGYIARVTLVQAGRRAAQGQVVLSVVKNIADDLRYGFYASYANAGGDYNAKAAMLSDLHINAVEFYDYFPAHGYYAPKEANYQFEPFGTKIDARDIQRKIEAGHAHDILSLAYVAAYAASESVYKQHPNSMTDASGDPKIFNGSIMSEPQADREKKPKWFWLMDVAPGSEWHKYILSEFGRTLDDKPSDLVSFDGFEIDTYGDSPDTKFYAKNSSRNGDLLSNVLHDFVGDTRALTHQIKPYGLVSFNSVNEFGIGRMYDVTDFLFLEIWRGHTDNLSDIVDICFRHRAPHQQRVVLKMYPADSSPRQTTWTENALRRLLGATMTGAGSLMVAGEPDEKKGQMHALNTLYYPDHKPMPAANAAILRDYYTYDALLFGYTHGHDVKNTFLNIAVPDCITRTYAVSDKKALVVQLLQVGDDARWSTEVTQPALKKNDEVSFKLPGGEAPKTVYFASPDVPTYHAPVKLDFDASGGNLRVQLPELRVYGTLILQY